MEAKMETHDHDHDDMLAELAALQAAFSLLPYEEQGATNRPYLEDHARESGGDYERFMRAMLSCPDEALGRLCEVWSAIGGAIDAFGLDSPEAHAGWRRFLEVAEVEAPEYLLWFSLYTALSSNEPDEPDEPTAGTDPR